MTAVTAVFAVDRTGIHGSPMGIAQGRKTRKRREAVAMALTYDPGTREAIVCSAWGPNTEWIRNLRAHLCRSRSSSGMKWVYGNHGFVALGSRPGTCVHVRAAFSSSIRAPPVWGSASNPTSMATGAFTAGVATLAGRRLRMRR